MHTPSNEPKTIPDSVRTRVQAEAELLRAHLKSRSSVSVGAMTVGDKNYVGVVVRDVTTTNGLMATNRTDVLLLLSDDYPRTPPIGAYLPYPYESQNRHFVHYGAHGAADLQAQGWYFLCHGLGGFDDERVRSWRPGVGAADGHNLIGIFSAAQLQLTGAQ